MYLKFTFIVIICITFISCERHISKHTVFYHDYQKGLMSFPDSLVSHFPEQLIDMAGYYNTPHSDENSSTFVLNQTYKIEIVDSIVNHYSRKAMVIYNADDSCLFVINRFAHYSKSGKFYGSFKTDMKRPIDCDSSYLPLPNFYDLEGMTPGTLCRLDKDFNIYLLSAGSSELGEELKGKWERWLPENWKNGYSAGIAVNETSKQVLYWVSKW